MAILGLIILLTPVTLLSWTAYNDYKLERESNKREWIVEIEAS